jgi:hypothetical protein
MRNAIIGLGAAIGLAMLSGCVPPPAPAAVVVAPPPPPIVSVPVALVPEPPLPAPVHHHVVAAHPAVHHHVHRYVTRTRVLALRSPYCGSIVHPCNVEHVTAPVQ